MKRVEFIVESKIVTKQRPRTSFKNGVVRTYTPKETENYENLVKLCYKEATKEDNLYFGNKPLEVHIVAYFLIPQDKEKYLNYRLPCTNHKDLDNIAKTILDSLNKVAFDDDKQVVSLYVEKAYSDREFVKVSITEKTNIDDIKEEYNRVQKLKKVVDIWDNKPHTKVNLDKMWELLSITNFGKKEHYEEILKEDPNYKIEEHIDFNYIRAYIRHYEL